MLEIPFEAPYQAENAMLAVKTAVVLGQRERGFRLTEAQITEGSGLPAGPGVWSGLEKICIWTEPTIRAA